MRGTWNTYNEYLPLDTLALCGALAEWGYAVEAEAYLGFFFQTHVCSQNVCHTISGKGGTGHKNVSKGEIIYSVFGCDLDADYGRLIALFVQVVRTSGNTTWAATQLPPYRQWRASSWRSAPRRLLPSLRAVRCTVSLLEARSTTSAVRLAISSP